MSGEIVGFLLWLLSAWEVWMGWIILSRITGARRSGKKREIVIQWGCVLGLGVLLGMARERAFLSVAALLVCAAVISAGLGRLTKTGWRVVLGASGIYFSFVALLDLALALLYRNWREGLFMSSLEPEKEIAWNLLLYTLTRLWIVIIMILAADMWEDVREKLVSCRNLLLVLWGILTLLLFRYETALAKLESDPESVWGILEGMSILLILCGLGALAAVFLRWRFLEQERELLALQHKLWAEQFQKMQESRRTVHDMKQHVLLLRKYAKEKEWEELTQYLGEISRELLDEGISHFTGIRDLDFLLSQKKKRAETEGIQMTVDTPELERIPLQPQEQMALFGNLLDNAIEACETLKEENRWIRLTIRKSHQLLMIKIENSIRGNRAGEEKPSKSRTGLHGYGLKSIRQIVEQHGGEMNAGARGECFCVRLLFFSEEEKKLQTENEHVTDKSLMLQAVGEYIAGKRSARGESAVKSKRTQTNSKWKKFGIPVILILTGILVQIYYLYPWIRGAEHTYNSITYLLAVFREGGVTELMKQEFPVSLELGGNLTVFAVQFALIAGLMTVAQLLSVIAVIGGVTGFRFKICSAVPGVIGGALMYLAGNIVAPNDVFVGNREILGTLTCYYPYFAVIAAGILYLVIRALEVWDESARRVEAEREARRAYRKERKRRLRFPGHYSGLFYRILWKDLKYRWKDMAFLFLSAFLSALFLFLGLGIYQNFSGSYGEDGGMLGLGLVEIMRDFLAAIVFVGLFLVSSTLSFYQKRKLASTGLIETMGIRSGTLFATRIGELLGCLVASVLGAYAAGSVLLFFLCRGIARWLPGYESSGMAGAGVYLWTFVGMAFLGLCAYAVSLEMRGSSGSTDTRNTVVKWEPLTGRFPKVSTAAAGILGIIFLYFYQQRRMAESIILACALLLCAALAFRGVWGMRLAKIQRNIKETLPVLPRIYRLRYRFRTTARYLSLLMVVHVFALSLFSIKFISTRIADDPEDMYPYDYVYLANSQDGQYFDRLERECQAKIYSFPMVRATTLDNTEMPNQFTDIVVQQGQNIGISESTYRELKELAGEPWEDLTLDDAGRQIHVVYQQDQASKAKPLDWYLWTDEPYVHIGQALMAQNPNTRRETYPPREIISEEREALIGAFRQGKYENLIVFSDAYFESVKDSWKTTDLLTGEPVAAEEAVPDVTIHEWPTQLTLVNVPEEYQERADEILDEFRKAHAFDEAFDPLVKSAYIGGEGQHQREMERQMETLVNGIVLLMLLAVGIFLLRMKVKMDLPELRKDYRFMETFGMGEKERTGLMKREISRYVRIPLLLGAGVSLVLTGILWKLRLYQTSDMTAYLKWGLLVWGAYILIQIMNMKLIQRNVVREVEADLS